MKSFKSLCLLIFLVPIICFSQKENVDLNIMNQIRHEGLDNSQVMDIGFHLTEASGPRLTNSPGYFRAANYAKDQLTQWGLQNAHLDPWGDFGKSWELEKSYIAMTAPWYKPIAAYPKAWTAGSNGLQHAEVLLIDAEDSTALEAYRGKLAGKILILDRTDNYNMSFQPDAIRFTDAELDSMAKEEMKPVDTAAMRKRYEAYMKNNKGGVQNLLKKMAIEEGAVAMFSSSPRNHDGTIFVQQAGPYKLTDPENFLDIALQYEDYMMLVRLLKNNIPVKMDLEVQTKFFKDDIKGYNVIAEIPGTDPKLKDQIVMIGGHLDSWQSGTGATDNAAGSMVMMEAIRILKTIGIHPRRTIRIALWSGEEQGLLGSRGYVKKTFADSKDMKLLPEHSKLSVYFNLDNGSGKIRGVYLQENAAVKYIFSQWLAPFHDLGAKTLTISNTGGTDHLAFDAVGLPGFQFIQDPLEYDTRTHHSNMDVYEHLQEDDLKQAATIVAAFVYDAAMRDEMIPRKKLPEPRKF